MLTIPGPQSRDDGRMSRRSWLRIGGLAMGGLALPEILRAEARSGQGNPAKGIIMVLLPGGPTHLDTFDLKPDAPVEFRGEFRPIATNVPGMRICEHLPRLARHADKYCLIRSMNHPHPRHGWGLYYMLTGRRHNRPDLDAPPRRVAVSSYGVHAATERYGRSV